MRYCSLQVNLFGMFANTDGEVALELFEIESADWSGHLLAVWRDLDGDWKFDALWTRDALYRLRDWWSERETET